VGRFSYIVRSVAIHPETVQHQVTAKLIPTLVFARLHAPDNLHVCRSLLPEVPPDNGCKLLKGLEHPEVQLREKVTGKDDAAVRVDYKRLQQHWLLFLAAQYPHQIPTKSQTVIDGRPLLHENLRMTSAA
jgi:hypothetical protein